jgi:DNA-binding NarL/FixJ family response regulator
MYKQYILVILFILPLFSLIAQNTNLYNLQDKNSDYVENFDVLADKNYTFEQILHDKSLAFTKYADKYDMKGLDYYWLRFIIKNPSPYTKYGFVSPHPNFHNVLYSYDAENKTWKTSEAGMEIDNQRRRGSLMPCVFQANSTDTFFLKVKVSPLATQPYKVGFDIKIEQEKYTLDNEQFMMVLWIATLFTMTAFFLYNLYIYFIFKDLTYLYYLVIVLGGIIYITGLNNYFNILLPFRLFNIEVKPNGNVYWFDLNQGIRDFGIVLVMGGFIQFTRIYLQLFRQFPLWDKTLRYILYGFSGVMLCNIVLTGGNIYYIDNFIAFPSNIAIMLIILIMLYVGIISLRKGYTPARYFLFANAIPLLIMLVLAGYFAIYKFYGRGATLLPNLAILSQALTFAVALVARVNNLKEELQQKEMEAQVLKAENEQMVSRNQFIELENEYIMAEIALEKNQKEELQAKLEANQRELASNTLYLFQKNELLTNLQKQIENLSQKSIPQHKEELKEIKATIKNSLHLETDWEKFKLHFEQVHPNFFKELLDKHPNLTNNEIRLCAYFHLNLSAKEIAALLNINPESVHRAKTRLNKKLNTIVE